MPNSFFKFKQFTIHQDKCAMKVCTDACLFGSLIPTFSKREGALKVLDIGTGTGLLSLMFAQKNNAAIIDAVEIDEPAAMQAESNFQQSPWKEKLKVHLTPVQLFDSSVKYDLVISNPPFFENDLKSSDAKRNFALHGDTLTFEDLINAVKNNLSGDGIFAALLPFHRSVFFEKLAVENNFYLHEKILVKQTPVHDYFRSILFFGRTEKQINQSEIIVKNAENQYTAAFAELLKDFYLYL